MAVLVIVRPGQVESFGFSAQSPSPVTAFTSLFVHANSLHLMGNMVFLAAVGAAVEIATGWKRFLAVYLSSGIFAVLVFWLAMRSSNSPVPLVGASGCIAGCATYFSIRYTRFRVPVAPKVSASIATMTLIWLSLQFLGAMVKVGEPLGASGFLAHLGGAICGLILGALFKAPDLGSRKIGHQVYEALNDSGPDAQIAHLIQHLKDHPEDLEMQLKLAEEYAEIGEKQNEAKLLSTIVFKLSGVQKETAVQRLFELKSLDLIPSARLRQLADDLPDELSTRLLWFVVNRSPSDPQRPEAMLQLLTINSTDDKERALIQDLLVADYKNHPILDVAKKRGLLR